MNWVKRTHDLDVVTVILQGTRDDSVPISASAALWEKRPDLVTLVNFNARHTLYWNVDPERWRNTVTRWLIEQWEVDCIKPQELHLGGSYPENPTQPVVTPIRSYLLARLGLDGG